MKEKLFVSIFLISLLALPIFTMAQSTAISDSDLAKMTDTEKITDLYKATINNQDSISKVLNKMKYGVSVTGTDYDLSQDKNYTVCAKVHDVGTPINNAFCNAQIFFPNKTVFTSFIIPYLNNSRGLYCKSDMLDNVTGVYPVDVECSRPYTSFEEIRYLINEGVIKELHNSTSGNINISSQITALTSTQGERCSGAIFSEVTEDMGVNYTGYGFLEQIINISMWFQNSGGSESVELSLKFWKTTDSGDVFLGETENTSVSLGTAITKVVFSDLGIEHTFDGTSTLTMDFCARRNGGGTRNIILWYNSTSFDSKFYMISEEINATVDFVVQGSSELNIKNSTFEQNIINNDNTNHFSLLNVLNTNFTTAFNKLDNIYNLLIGHDNNMNSNFTNTNGIINTQFNNLNINMLGNFTFTNNQIANLSNDMNANFTSINNAITSFTSSLGDIVNQILFRMGSAIGIYLGS